MSKNKKIILMILLILMIFMICIISFIVWKLKNNENLNEKYYHSEHQTHIGEDEYTKKIVEVNNKDRYYMVKNMLNTYITYVKQMNGIIGFQKYDDKEVIEKGISLLYDILDSNYIIENNITPQNLQNLIPKYSDYKLEIDKMYSYEKADAITIYFVYAKIDDNDFNVLVKTDSVNMTFSIFLGDYIEKNGYNEQMNIDDIKINDDLIEKNNNNQYKYTNISDEYMMIQYMDAFKNNIINDTEYTFNNLMEKEYRDKRFESLENFISYVEENEESIKNIEPKKYIVNEYDDYKEYVCTDQYNNYYIFKENAIMNYTFKLDTYTITTEKFESTYLNAQNERKVQMNIDKFFQMLNRKDYITSYDCLADSFKSNYSMEEEDFKNYIKKEFFEYNEVEYKSCELSGNNLYVCKLELSDLTGQNLDKRTVTLIVQLQENLDFKMAIEMK